MTISKHILLLAALTAPLAATAQKGKDSVIHSNTIEIIQSYKPEVKQAPKPEFTPALPPVDTSHPVVTHTVPAQTLYFSYHSLPLKPLALGRDTTTLPFANYAKLGGGNLSTIYLDAGVGSVNGENYESAFHLYHLSQSGSIKGQKSSQTRVEGLGTLHTAGHAFTAGVDVIQNSFHRYGYGYAMPPAEYSPAALSLGGVRLKGTVENETENDYGIQYKPEVQLSFMGGSEISNEKKFGINIPVTYQVDTFITVQAGLEASYTGLSAQGLHLSTGIVQVHPGIIVKKGPISGHAFLSPSFGQGGTAYLLPDIALSVKTIKNILDVDAGWKATLNQNSYEGLYLVNPYIIFTPSLNAQYRKEEIYGSVKTNLINHIYLEGRISHLQFYNMPLFLNSFDGTLEPGSMEAVTESMIKAVSFQANACYQVGSSFAAGLSGTWTNYYKSTSAQVWHQPGVKIKGDLLIRPLKQLVVTAYLSFLDEIYSRDELGFAIKLKPILDLGGGAEYTFIERLSAFVQVNNLLNNKNERWMYYPSYGANIYGGLRFKF